jgi:ribosome recycling factor
MADEPDLDDVKRRMDGAVQTLKGEFSGLRTGRATTAMLEPVQVEAYGSHMPLNQVATISVPEPRMITVQVWDRSMAIAVDKAIRAAGLGVNPITEGQLIRVPIPELTRERRTELAKLASKYSESARVAVRNVRRDGMDMLKKMEKDHKISEDDHRLYADEIQSMTDASISEIDKAFAAKEKDIMQV